MRKAGLHILLASLLFILLLGCQPSSDSSPVNFPDAEALVEHVRSRIVEISIADLDALQASEEYFVLIDVRADKEHDRGYIPGSVLIPRGSLEFRVGSESFWDEEGLYLPEKSDKLVLYCKSGKRSVLATETLQKLGYDNVSALAGGFNTWKEEKPEKVEVNLAPVIPHDGAGVIVEEDVGGC